MYPKPYKTAAKVGVVGIYVDSVVVVDRRMTRYLHYEYQLHPQTVLFLLECVIFPSWE